jgi:hypothetical protein
VWHVPLLWLIALDYPNFNHQPRHSLRHVFLLTMSSDAEDEGLGLFQEPADFYQPEKQATFASHKLLSGKDLTVRLVGHNPLWVRLHPRSDFSKHSTNLLLFGDAKT